MVLCPHNENWKRSIVVKENLYQSILYKSDGNIHNSNKSHVLQTKRNEKAIKIGDETEDEDLKLYSGHVIYLKRIICKKVII